MTREHELLLSWVSESGEGTWRAFKETHDWLFNKNRREEQRIPPTRTATMMAILGHLEIDWEGRVWAAAPPVLTIIPSAGAHALLTGGRTRTLAKALEEETSPEATQDIVAIPPFEQFDAPDVVYLATDDESRIVELAERLGVQYEFSVPDRLSKLLPSLDAYLEASVSSPGARGFEVEKWSASSEFGWTETLNDSAPGFYRYGLYGGYVYRFVNSESEYFAVDLATGAYTELRRIRRQVLRYRRDSVNGTLIVPWGAPLPILHARAAALCSGLAPQSVSSERSRRFVNVPIDIAQRISLALGQDPLEITDSSSKDAL